MSLNVPVTFINDLQSKAYYATERNQNICGGFGSGKTYIYAEKAVTLLTSFQNYRLMIGRMEYKALKHTTMKTFFKVIPPELYEPPLGRFSEQDGYLRLVNGSEVLFMHLDAVDEKVLRGLEINSCLLDQAEEISESTADILSARCGRWDKAIPNPGLLSNNPAWPMRFICSACTTSFYGPGDQTVLRCQNCGSIANRTSIYYAPTYFLNTCNPESETHWLYRRFHPESSERLSDHFYLEFPSDKNPALDPETLRVMMSKDPAWVKRFVYGQWGISEGTIHHLLPDSILEPSAEWIANFLKKAALVRVLDHGDSAPTCCLWFGTWEGKYICYREYYQPGALISAHRQNIADLSGDENYRFNLADPAIFKKMQQKNGGFWNTADEYMDRTITTAPPIPFLPADNNELATRNRINEYLALDRGTKHPLMGESPAPRLYFIKRNPEKYSSTLGCENAITQLKMQKRKKLGELNGKPYYSEERDDSIPDHSYDCVRYFCAQHTRSNPDIKPVAPENSFKGIMNRFKMLKMASRFDGYGMPRARA